MKQPSRRYTLRSIYLFFLQIFQSTYPVTGLCCTPPLPLVGTASSHNALPVKKARFKAMVRFCSFCCLMLCVFAAHSPSFAATMPDGAPQTSAASPNAAPSGSVTIPPFDTATKKADVTNEVTGLAMFVDPTGQALLSTILSSDAQQKFTPYTPWQLPHSFGAFWLRMPIATPPVVPSVLDLHLALRHLAPLPAKVWMLQPNSTPQELKQQSQGVYLLPNGASGPQTLYVQLSSLPAPGFMPAIRPVFSSMVENLGLAFSLLFAALLVACFVRGLVERSEWRLWSALFLGAVLTHMFWGLPVSGQGSVKIWELPGLLAPGIALLILPQVGRHIMATRDKAPHIDKQYLMLGIFGLVLFLLPLVPQFGWLTRFVPYWALCMLLFVPTSLFALAKKVNGAKLFLLLCAIPPISMAIALLLTGQNGFNASILSFALAFLPQLGLVASALLLTFLPTPLWLEAPTNKRREDSAKNKRKAKTSAALEQSNPLYITEDLSESLPPSAPSSSTDTPKTADVDPKNAPPLLAGKDVAVQQLESDLREIADNLFIQLAALDQTELNENGRAISSALTKSSRRLIGLAQKLPKRFQQETVIPKTSKVHHFDLRELMLHVYNAVDEKAQDKNLALSWFTAPYLHRYFKGDALMLYKVLTMLTESAVAATQTYGMVQLRVQRLPESNDPGHLVFSVIDTGSGMPPHGRSAMAFVRAWEFVASLGGSLRVDTTPTGTVVTCTLRFHAVSSSVPMPQETDTSGSTAKGSLQAAKTSMPNLHAIVASDVPVNRQLMAFYLDELPHEVIEARSSGEIASLYTRTPGALLVLDGDLPEEEMVNAIANIRSFEGENNYPPTSIIVLANDEAQAANLRRAGCTHTLFKPILRTELRHLVLRLSPLPKKPKKRPKPAAKKAQSASKQASSSAVKPAATPLQDVPDLSMAPPDSATSTDIVQTAPQSDASNMNADEGLSLWGLLRPRTNKVSKKRNAQEADATAKPTKNQTFSLAPTFPIKASSNVGEPMPIVKNDKDDNNNTATTPKPKKAAVAVSRQHEQKPASPFAYTAPTNTAEWVGEPMPIVKTGDATHEAFSDTVADTSFATTQQRPFGRAADTGQTTAPSFANVGFNAQSFATSSHTTEWVGEPMPIVKSAEATPEQATDAASDTTFTTAQQRTGEEAADTAQTATSSFVGFNAQSFADSSHTTEWVGEPMPIVKDVQKAPEAPKAEPSLSPTTAAEQSPTAPAEASSDLFIELPSFDFTHADTAAENDDEEPAFTPSELYLDVTPTEHGMFFDEETAPAPKEDEHNNETLIALVDIVENKPSPLEGAPLSLHPQLDLPMPEGDTSLTLNQQDNLEEPSFLTTEEEIAPYLELGPESEQESEQTLDPELGQELGRELDIEEDAELKLNLVSQAQTEPLTPSSVDTDVEGTKVEDSYVEEGANPESADIEEDELATAFAHMESAFADLEIAAELEDASLIASTSNALGQAAQSLHLHTVAGQALCLEDLAKNGDAEGMHDVMMELREAILRAKSTL